MQRRIYKYYVIITPQHTISLHHHHIISSLSFIVCLHASSFKRGPFPRSSDFNIYVFQNPSACFRNQTSTCSYNRHYSHSVNAITWLALTLVPQKCQATCSPSRQANDSYKQKRGRWWVRKKKHFIRTTNIVMVIAFKTTVARDQVDHAVTIAPKNTYDGPCVFW